MSSPNVKLGYCRTESSEKLFFSVSCSLSAGFVPFSQDPHYSHKGFVKSQHDTHIKINTASMNYTES
ncbi:BgTH12-07211 [Blumeria graminis f. sp. triticale]|uniref:BgTH12-07211 n=1 Tax=Blumeria graminis f. sp. triticale TaxID=1689686 RepID=A0A9W4D943_BLUGR|nr:BgTH12-07211 [Blumeria graminis f. sp. triticale]